MSVEKALDPLDIPDGESFSVGALRERSTDLSQPKFAEAYHFTLPTLRKWERDPQRVTPAIRAYLSLIEKAPDFVRSLVNKTSTEVESELDQATSDAAPAEFDLKELRKERLGLSREQFAFKYGLNDRTLESWEAKPTSMTPPIRAYMGMINDAPELVHKLLIAATQEDVDKIIAEANA